ncbi:DUF2127 domain-containing protein [Kutzneria sp. CA-103260]|uniref:DUF2127 domain-containing protein n=1 Tax=Kutzneria sp. CA-103260 TaxID=2802641 RepID=UPI001BED5914|nr:DUF2127 domain-containing protein [Kutzneria sp. CA-103260]QUQ68879.1 hypothetical protein JJ691_66270 [Kutzneria sp. CA-103260]
MTNSTTTDKLFRVAIAIKGLDGLGQLALGIVLIFIPPTVITGLANEVVTRDLLGDPDGTLSTHLQTAAHNFADGSSRGFAIGYLLLHAVIKLGLVAALLRKIMPLYPVAVVVLGAFVVYEVYRAVNTHSIALPIFAAIDIVIIVLVVREYVQLRRERAASATEAHN